MGIRELRNAGKVVADLAWAGAGGRVTSGGLLAGSGEPGRAAADEFEARGTLRRG